MAAFSFLSRSIAWLAGRGLRLLAIVYFAIAALVLVLKFGVLPRVPEYREEIAQAIAASIGEPVSIGGIEAGWGGLHPTLSITDLRIAGRDGAPAFVLPRIWAQVSWRSLAVLDLRFRSIVLYRPSLDVRRAADGKLFIAGIELKDGPGHGPGLGDWVLRQGEVTIDDGSIQWHDEVRRAPPLALTEVTLRLVNRWGDQHRVALRAVPPPALASALDVRADLKGESLDALPQWAGRLFLDLDYAELGAWRAWLDYPVDVTAGRGQVRAWFDVAEGHVTHATADLRLVDVEARLARDLPRLRLAQVSGRIGVAEGKPGRGFFGLGAERAPSVTAFGQALSLTQRGAPALAPFDFTVRWDEATARTPERGEARATRIDLAPLAALGESLPLPRTMRAALATASPRGRLTELTAQWTGAADALTTYRARAQFAALAMNPVGGLPGVGPLAGVLEMNERGGTAKVDGTGVTLEYPRVFRHERIPAFDTFNAQVEWSLGDAVERDAHRQIEVRFPVINLANADFAASGNGRWRSLPRGPGEIDITLAVPRSKATAVHRYFAFLPGRAPEWLKNALVAGEGTDGRIRWSGDIYEFPYATPTEGTFEMKTQFTGGQLQFHPEWPRIEGLNGEFSIEGHALSASARGGSVLGLQIGASTARIAELLGPEEAIVEVASTAEGAASEFRKYVAQSPLRETVGRGIAEISAEGPGRLRLGLTVPLRRIPETRVQGSYQFVGNRVTVGIDHPPFNEVNGRLDFTERTISGSGITAQFLGGVGTISVATPSDLTFVITGQATAGMTAVAAAYDFPFLSRARGHTAYRTQVTISPRSFDIAIDSALQGVTFDLPAPFTKAANDALALSVTRSLDREAGGRNGFTLKIGDLVAANARFRRDDSADGVNHVVERVAIGVGAPAPDLPVTPSIVVAGTLPWIDLDATIDALRAEFGAANSPTAPSVDVKVRADRGNPLRLAAVTLDATELVALGRRLTNASLRASPVGTATLEDWKIAINATEIAGEIDWKGAGRGHATARLKHLIVPERAQKPSGAPDDPLRDLPTLDVAADAFTLNGKAYGRMRLLAANEERLWRINDLVLTAPEGVMRATGTWQASGTGTRTDVNVRVDVTDAGGYLARLGQSAAVKGGIAALEGRLGWAGPPTAIDYASLQGSLDLKAERGQFLKVDPGMGRLLGVLSLQALPRRMSLDFRDVFSEGFAFDEIVATAKVEGGIAHTKDFRMVGPPAAIALSGDADLGRETQHLQVRVVPVIGDSLAAVAGLALLNPVLGITTFLAQRLLRDPLGQMLAYEYEVTGSWGDPKVTRVLNDRDRTVPAAEAAPPTDAVPR